MPGALEALQRNHKLLPTLLEELEDYHRSVASYYERVVSLGTLKEPVDHLSINLVEVLRFSGLECLDVNCIEKNGKVIWNLGKRSPYVHRFAYGVV